MPYTGKIVVQGGALPYNISASGLPDGLFVNSTTGQITGSPSALLAATSFKVTVTDVRTDALLGTYSADQLTAGLALTLPPNSAAVLAVSPN